MPTIHAAESPPIVGIDPKFNNSDLDSLIDWLDELPVQKIPAAMIALAAGSQRLAARLLVAGNGAEAKPDNGKLLTVAEAAERTGMSKVYLYRNADKLQFTVRVGRSLRFSEIGLERWIKARSGR